MSVGHHVLVSHGPVWTATLSRAHRANALSADLVEDLHTVLDLAEGARPEALVLRGNDRHFSAGFDLGGLSSETDASLAHRFQRIGELLERLVAAPFPTIAVAEGAAIGAGADLVIHCHHRLVAPSVELRFPGSAFGVQLGTARRSELGEALVTGWPDDLPAVLADPAIDRPAHDATAALTALAVSTGRPGLHERLTSYSTSIKKKEPA